MTGRQQIITRPEVDTMIASANEERKAALAAGDTAAEWQARVDALLERRGTCPAA